jgi:hypothetical protein
MINKKKLEVYREYNGDVDLWARIGTEKFITVDDWALIQQLINDVRLINRGLASEHYRLQVEAQILNSCDSNETAEFLRYLANKGEQMK